MEIPAGYRELNKGEIIKSSDLAWASDKEWVEENKLEEFCGAGDATGQKYLGKPGGHYTTIRKIDHKNKTNYCFFVKNKILGEYDFLVCASAGGWFFKKDGSSYSGDRIESYYNLDYGEQLVDKVKFKKVSSNVFFSKLSLKGRKEVSRILGIKQKTAPVSEESKIKIIEELKQKRASNKDSAFQFDDLEKQEICYSLLEENKVGQSDVNKERFYVIA